MAKIERWVFPHYDKMIVILQPGNGLPELRSCLFGIDEHGEVAKILYCSQFGEFFTREKDGWHRQIPSYAQSRRKGWKKTTSGVRSFYSQMRHFGGKFCHILVAFAWCRRPSFVTLPDGYMRPCYMDYECGRMYYKDHLLDAQDNFVQDKDGNYVYIKVYLQVDHLNGVHDDCNAENLEYVTSQENWRRRSISSLIVQNGLNPKKLTYGQLRYAFTINPNVSIESRIHYLCAMVRDGFSPQL